MVCDEDGRLLPKVCEILDIAAQYRLVVGTGHIGAGEGIPLVEGAVKHGVKKIVLTHADNPFTEFTLEHILLTTDFGQPESPYPDEGMLKYAQGLIERGVSRKTVEHMIKNVPARLIYED